MLMHIVVSKVSKVSMVSKVSKASKVSKVSKEIIHRKMNNYQRIQKDF